MNSNDTTTTTEIDTRDDAERTEETFEVREEAREKLFVSEFEQAPLTDINFGF